MSSFVMLWDNQIVKIWSGGKDDYIDRQGGGEDGQVMKSFARILHSSRIPFAPQVCASDRRGKVGAFSLQLLARYKLYGDDRAE